MTTDDLTGRTPSRPVGGLKPADMLIDSQELADESANLPRFWEAENGSIIDLRDVLAREGKAAFAQFYKSLLGFYLPRALELSEFIHELRQLAFATEAHDQESRTAIVSRLLSVEYEEIREALDVDGEDSLDVLAARCVEHLFDPDPLDFRFPFHTMRLENEHFE